MKIRILPYDLSICRTQSIMHTDIEAEIFFIAKTDEEISVVCQTDLIPEDTTDRNDGWKALRIEGVLDLSLTGILLEIAAVLAREKISIFAISTFNTDYILVKADDLDRAAKALSDSGYDIL